MNKWTSALVGAVGGAAISAIFLYLFAPARGTTFDENYQSRLDWALAEGEKAAREREQELLMELEQARMPVSASDAVEGDGNANSSTSSPESTGAA